MRQSNFKTWINGMALVGLLLLASCDDLDEQLPGRATADNFLQSEDEIVAAVGEAYSNLNTSWGAHNGMYSMQEVASDEVVIPQRGQDWFDGGLWLRHHQHKFNFEEGAINNAWNWAFGGVNTVNRLIFTLETAVSSGSADQSVADRFISELRAMRVYYYYWLLDSFGNVPIVTSFDGAPESPANNANFQAGRTELFNFLESELKVAIPLLSEDARSTYGRMNTWGARFLLAKLYMNAEVYTGTPRYADALPILNAIIDSGNYGITGDYFANFAPQNQNSPETIFAIPYDEVFVVGFNLAQMTLHYGMQFTFNLQDQPWNGYATLEHFYNQFESEDVRRNGFLVGDQFNVNTGEQILDPSAEDADENGPPLTLRVKINELFPNALRESGARFGKFQYEVGARPNLNNDFPVFRYADVLLMKAEVLFRQNGGSDVTALGLVNQIRTRAEVEPFSTLTFQNLLAERGRELYLEIWRRQDLIRFPGGSLNPDAAGATAFNDDWTLKGGVSDAKFNVFPIPRDQLEANLNLKQNPGF